MSTKTITLETAALRSIQQRLSLAMAHLVVCGDALEHCESQTSSESDKANPGQVAKVLGLTVQGLVAECIEDLDEALAGQQGKSGGTQS